MSKSSASASAPASSAVTHEQIKSNGIELHVAIAGPADGKPVVLCHGFPELWYSWRNQLAALAQAGYRAFAPDLRGYGASSNPKDVGAYGADKLTGDLCGLLDHYGYEKAAFVGHDWGALLVWEMGRLHPDRVSSLYNMSVPYSNAPAPPTSAASWTISATSRRPSSGTTGAPWWSGRWGGSTPSASRRSST